MQDDEEIKEVKDTATGVKCVQSGKAQGEDARDDDKIENNPGAFAAEQTWPTEAEIRNAQQRRGSEADEQDQMVEMDTGEPVNIGGFNVPKKEAGPAGEGDLAELFDRMQIKMVGREDG